MLPFITTSLVTSISLFLKNPREKFKDNWLYPGLCDKQLPESLIHMTMVEGTRNVPGLFFLSILLPVNNDAKLVLKWLVGVQSRPPSATAGPKNFSENEIALRY